MKYEIHMYTVQYSTPMNLCTYESENVFLLGCRIHNICSFLLYFRSLIEEFYVMKNIPALGQLISILLQISELERSKTTQLSALYCLNTLYKQRYLTGQSDTQCTIPFATFYRKYFFLKFISF